jgi:hypothetical protein
MEKRTGNEEFRKGSNTTIAHSLAFVFPEVAQEQLVG